MSTILYAALTKKREQATPGTSENTQAPGVSTYVDAMAALIPAEILTVHAVILTFTTSTAPDASGQQLVKISEPGPLALAFWALIVINLGIYFLKLGSWPGLNWNLMRAAIPSLAFVLWTMLQKSTAFDAVAPDWTSAYRNVVAVLGAFSLGAVATGLGKKADEEVPRVPLVPVVP